MVIFHRLAYLEFFRARRRYAGIGPALGERFTDAVNAVVALIDSDPNAGVAYSGIIRWLKPRRFPYVIYFKPLGNGDYLVFAVAHKHRKPGYWLRRGVQA